MLRSVAEYISPSTLVLFAFVILQYVFFCELYVCRSLPSLLTLVAYIVSLRHCHDYLNESFVLERRRQCSSYVCHVKFNDVPSLLAANARPAS